MIFDKLLQGERVSAEESRALFYIDRFHDIGAAANELAEKRHGKDVYYVLNRHINPTNICINRCRFCAFSRSLRQEDAFELSIEEIINKLKGDSLQIKEVHIVGGLHPQWGIDHYVGIIKAVREHLPAITIKAYSAVEIDHLSRISGLDIDRVLTLLKDAGLDMLPGGGAEIFAPEIRKRLCPEKISGERWLYIMERAHRLGIRSNATMLYGHLEAIEDRIDHLIKLRDLQDRTGGFQAFIPLSYHPVNTDIGGDYTGGIDDLLTIAASRIILDNFDHIKAYWVMLGEKIAQTALLFGANDLDGTVIEEKITHSAGALTTQSMSREALERLIVRAGKVPVERDGFYRPVSTVATLKPAS
jgi:aminodeoxyfutalosine synthase